eukprot:TRINITY_DN76744_c0_g1_i1.p1 TRINITY_DN76744_c0_g1~~TRINITY_DN76744_c0_g1_i1.p1  ORF type:complete len:267 (+),score=46.73 TRINITY_DN76744_c0_g1_i1:260-1060(+)
MHVTLCQAEEPGTEAQATVSVGAALEDIVYPAWFAGDWDSFDEFVGAEMGAGGERALAATFPDVDQVFRKNSAALGQEAALKRARHTWLRTKRPAPLAPKENGGAIDKSNAGIMAASIAMLGRGSSIRSKDDVSGPVTWQASAQGGKRSCKIRAAGAVGRPDPNDDSLFKISELFEVEPPATDDASTDRKTIAVVRVTTNYRRVSYDVSKNEPLKTVLGKLDTKRGYFIQAVQIATLIAGASGELQSGSPLAACKTRQVLSPLLSS